MYLELKRNINIEMSHSEEWSQSLNVERKNLKD